VRDEAREVAGRFEEVRRERQTLFAACYEHISQALQVIYKDLTRSSKHPLGMLLHASQRRHRHCGY
jgi:structural maintenance of chromosome 1